MRTISVSASMSWSSLARSTKAREVTIVLISGGLDVGLTCREIDHRRNPCRRHHAEQCHGRAIGIRQDHANRAALVGEQFKLAREDAGANQELAVAELAADRILDRDAAPAMQPPRLNDRFDDRPVGRCGAKDQVGHDLVEHCARRLPAHLALQRLVDLEAYWIEDADRDLGEPAAAHLRTAEAREDRGFEPLDPYGHDHCPTHHLPKRLLMARL